MPSALAETIRRIRDEGPIRLAKLAEQCGRTPAAMPALATRGIKKRGKTVKLEAFVLGGVWVTSEQAFERFLLAVQPDPDDVPEPSSVTGELPSCELVAAG